MGKPTTGKKDAWVVKAKQPMPKLPYKSHRRGSFTHLTSPDKGSVGGTTTVSRPDKKNFPDFDKPDPATELNKKALNISAGGCAYEKAASRRVRQRLAHQGNRELAVPLTHEPRASSASTFYTKVATENDSEQALWDLAKLQRSKTVTTPKSHPHSPRSSHHRCLPGNQPVMRGLVHRHSSCESVRLSPSRHLTKPSFAHHHPPPRRRHSTQGG